MALRPVLVLAGVLSIAAPAAAIAAVRLDGDVLVIEGTIRPLEQCSVATLLDVHPDIRRARIDSPGGDAWAGAQIGRLFGWADLEVVIPKGASAYSAAAIAALGAPRRRIDGYLGLHRPYLVGVDRAGFGPELVEEVIAEDVAVLREAGVTERVIDIAMQTRGNRVFLTITQQTADSFHHQGHLDRERVQHLAQACRNVPAPPAEAVAATRVQ